MGYWEDDIKRPHFPRCFLHELHLFLGQLAPWRLLLCLLLWRLWLRFFVFHGSVWPPYPVFMLPRVRGSCLSSVPPSSSTEPHSKTCLIVSPARLYRPSAPKVSCVGDSLWRQVPELEPLLPALHIPIKSPEEMGWRRRQGHRKGSRLKAQLLRGEEKQIWGETEPLPERQGLPGHLRHVAERWVVPREHRGLLCTSHTRLLPEGPGSPRHLSRLTRCPWMRGAPNPGPPNVPLEIVTRHLTSRRLCQISALWGTVL